MSKYEDYIYACPYCGQGSYDSIDTTVCSYCHKTINPIKSQYTAKDYFDKSKKIYQTGMYMLKVFIDEELSKNPLFDEELEKKRYEDWLKAVKEHDDRARLYRLKAQQAEELNTPKCPTCGSTKIKKISYTSKLVGAAIFGLLSKTARSQFCCESCGYKW